MKVTDLTGKRFGRLQVIKRAANKGIHAAWLCKCDCGTEKIIAGRHLCRGSTQSCGCLAAEMKAQRSLVDETGNRYGNLTVIAKTDARKWGAVVWLCRCDCGNEIMVIGAGLRVGYPKSCGCLRKLPKGEAAFNQLIHSVKRNARTRGYEWKLTKQEVRVLTKSKCFYCGVEPQQLFSKKDANGSYVYNGIDRVDNSIGYVPENVVPCCGKCNIAKHIQSQKQFRDWIKSVYENWVSKRICSDCST